MDMLIFIPQGQRDKKDTIPLCRPRRTGANPANESIRTTFDGQDREWEPVAVVADVAGYFIKCIKREIYRN